VSKRVGDADARVDMYVKVNHIAETTCILLSASAVRYDGEYSKASFCKQTVCEFYYLIASLKASPVFQYQNA
jgi:hypothetical protein